MDYNYLIMLIDENDDDWCVFTTTDYDYAIDLFDRMTPPPGYNMELRETTEDVDTYVDYLVIRYNHSNF